jgi:ribosomal protein RSM22 (predicted rRNA methylase)
VGLLIVSHVVTELDGAGTQALREALGRADAVVWVEPGTAAASRAVIDAREQLREKFHVIAPCTHARACGLLTPGNANHWCHHFASPPPGIMGDSRWVRFAQRAGIDLRSLPYSFLVLERKGLRDPVPGSMPAGWSRVLGEPRVYKGFAKLLSCQADGVGELELQKRAAPQVFRALKSGAASSIWRWKQAGQRITEAEPYSSQ